MTDKKSKTLTSKEIDTLKSTIGTKSTEIVAKTFEDESARMSDVGSEIVRRNLQNYAYEIIGSMFPNYTDGLKVVMRRIIWTLRDSDDFSLTSSNATAVRKYHDRGDSSISGAIDRLAQAFNVNPVLIEGDGDFGQYASPYAGAPRYTKSRLAAVARDVFLNGIELISLSKRPTSDYKEFEPICFIPAMPVPLWLNSTTVGYGYASDIPPRNFNNICRLAMAYVEHRIKHGMGVPFPIDKFADLLVPDMPIPNVISNYQELIAAYKKGDFDHPINLEGTASFKHDEIRIHTLPFGQELSKVIKFIQTEQHDKKSGWINQNVLGVDNPSNEDLSGNIIIKLKRGVNVFEAWERIRKAIAFSRPFHPGSNYSDDNGQIISPDPLFLLHSWYDRRKKLIMASKRRRIQSQGGDLRITEALLIIRDHTDQVVEIIKNNEEDVGKALIGGTFKLTPFQVDAIYRKNLGSLSKTSKQELTKQFEDQKAKLQETIRSLNTIPSEMIATLKRLIDKYPTPRVCTIPKFIGYVAVSGGTIQFSDVSEIEDILADFPKDDLFVHLYDGPNIYRVGGRAGAVQGYIPKYTSGEIVGLAMPLNKVFTVNIADGCACVVEGFVPGSWKDGYFYTTQKSKALTRGGYVKTIDVTEEWLPRKTICRGAGTDIVYVYPDRKKTHYLIVTNSTDPNVFTLVKIEGDSTYVPMSPEGDVRVIHSTSNKDWYFTIPPEHLNRANVRLFHIVDVEALMEGSKYIRVDILQTKWKRNKFLKMM